MDTLYTKPTFVSTQENTINLKEQKVYYNKSNNSLIINIPPLEYQTNIGVSIFNISGQLIYNTTTYPKTITINTNDWNNSLYFISISSQSNRTMSKLIISK
jgi:hypothetical protein